MQSGSNLFAELKSALERQRHETTSLRNVWQQLDRQLQELIAQRGATILELARHYLPELSRERVNGTFAEIRSDLQQVVERQERQLESLNGQRGRLQALIEDLEQQLRATTEQLSIQVSERERLSKLVTEKLAADELFQQASKLAIAAETELHQNEQRAREISTDASEKLPAYNRSSLFQYLRRVGFGTKEYARQGIIKRWDRWLAQLIGYARAIQSYEFLTTAPQLIHAEIERKKTEFHPLMATVEQIERRTAEELGLAQVLQAGDRLGQLRDELVAQVGEQRSLLQGVDQKLLDLQRTEGPFHAEALTRFRQFLERTETAALEQHARSTPEPVDDQLVARIRTLTTEIATLQPQQAQQQKINTQAEEHCAQLEFVTRRFQQANFDAPRSNFSADFALSRELDRLQKNVIDKDALWDNIRQAQQFEPTWIEESSRSMTGNAGQILANPLTQVLMHAMVEVAGAALQSAAQRSVQRRSLPTENRGARRVEAPAPQWTRINTPSRSAVPRSVPNQSVPQPAAPSRPTPTPPQHRRGFTTGDGF